MCTGSFDTGLCLLQYPSAACLYLGTESRLLYRMDSGEARLKALGYKQELKRDFTLVSNTAISFSIISTLLGITGDSLDIPLQCITHVW